MELEPGNSIQGSYVSGRNPMTRAITTASQDLHWQGAGAGDRAGDEPTLSGAMWDMGEE